MRQITSFIVALLVCIALWMMLAIQLTDFIVFDLPVRPQTRWQVLMQIWSDAPLLLVSVAAGMVIFRTQPLLFGITCALAAAASVVLCTSGPILMKPVFVVKWALFFGFAIAGSYLGWWILRLRNCQDTVLKVWQSLATLVVIFGIMALWQWWHTNRFMRRLFEPLVEAVQIEHSSEQHGGQISSEGAPSAPPNESSPWSLEPEGMKTIGKWILLVLVGLTVSVVSMFIQFGTDDSERETIGIQKKWGFPVTYRTTAPGLAWADFNGIRFGANTVVWTTGLASLLAAIGRMKRGSNKASHATSKPAPGAGSSAREG